MEREESGEGNNEEDGGKAVHVHQKAPAETCLQSLPGRVVLLKNASQRGNHGRSPCNVVPPHRIILICERRIYVIIVIGFKNQLIYSFCDENK